MCVCEWVIGWCQSFAAGFAGYCFCSLVFLHLALCPSALKHVMIHCNTLTGVENKRAREYRSSLVSSSCYQAAARQSAGAKTKVRAQAQNVLEFPVHTDHQMALFQCFVKLSGSSNIVQRNANILKEN